MKRTYSKLWLNCLTKGQHDNTCGYWYTITEGGTPHTAFATRAALLAWLHDRGLIVREHIPAPGEWKSITIEGEYSTECHMDVAAFESLEGFETREMSNGQYTKAIITGADSGPRTVHTLNPNVKTREVYDYQESRALFC